MDFKQLHYITAIAESQNITRAAENLFISRSALNYSLLNLEQEIGRIMRKDPKNPDKKAVWYDYVDASVGVLKGQYYSRRKVYKRLGINLPSKPKNADKDVIDGLLDNIKF